MLLFSNKKLDIALRDIPQNNLEARDIGFNIRKTRV